MDYLALPVVLKDGFLPRANLRDNIINSIGVILATRPGVLPFAPEFGCGLWEREFSDMPTARKGDISASLRIAISTHEKRLYDLDVTYKESRDERSSKLGLVVTITGKYLEDDTERELDVSFSL